MTRTRSSVKTVGNGLMNRPREESESSPNAVGAPPPTAGPQALSAAASASKSLQPPLARSAQRLALGWAPTPRAKMEPASELKKMTSTITRSVVLACSLAVAIPAYAQMTPELLKQASGQPLPSPDLPAGTISFRLFRGMVTKNIVGQKVDLTVDGKARTMTTDSAGRVEVSGLASGTRVKATTVVDGERLESQEITIGTTGIRVMLVATDPDAAKAEAGNKALAVGPPAKGSVVFGPESRVVMEMRDDRLNVYYLFDIQNAQQTPVDIGGPILLDLPKEARGASLLEGSTKQATAAGTRVTVLGPFAPGATNVQVAFELPYSGGTARLTQRLPANLPQVIVIVGQTGGLDLTSPQLTNKRELTDQGDRIIAGTGPALSAGQTLELAVTGLPHHALWPRYLALALAGSVMMLGIWAAVVAPPRRRTA
jgi:hypothetical protein